MRITFLGTGTSQGVPVIGCNCQVCSSSNPKDKRLRSSAMIQVGENTLIIDCGPDFRQQMLRENVTRINGILLTHEHKDHIGGLDDTRAYNYILKQNVKLFGTTWVLKAIQNEYHYAFAEYKYPGVPQFDLIGIDAQTPFEVSGLNIMPIQVFHHQMPVLGFRVQDFTYITDANLIPEEEKDKIKGSKVLVLNALRREKHISHFTLDEALTLIEELKPEQAYLTHISHQLGTHDDVEQELPKNVHLAFDGLKIEI